jgi:mannose-6-phosphate isomerase class I
MIPAGTPHGSGERNVILEVSATPSPYSLRFYDWLRRDADDNQRPVHLDHASNNLGQERIGEQVGERPGPGTPRPARQSRLVGADRVRLVKALVP